MKTNKGNILIISLIIIFTIIVIFIFILLIFTSQINTILYNFKLDMYSFNKTGIIAVNKNKTNIDEFSYNEKEYKDQFERLIKENYKLDDTFSNNEKLISNVEIKEYKIYVKGNQDNYTKLICKNNILHTVVKVKIKPIILKNLLENLFIFEIHEDVNLNLLVQNK